MLTRAPGRPRAAGGIGWRSHSSSGPGPGRGEPESESVSALVCKGCGRGFASLRKFNGHHSSPYVKPQCRGRQNGLEEDMVVTSRDVRVRSRGLAGPAEAPGTRHIQV